MKCLNLMFILLKWRNGSDVLGSFCRAAFIVNPLIRAEKLANSLGYVNRSEWISFQITAASLLSYTSDT